MSREELGEQITGPVVELAAKVKRAVEVDPSALIVETDHGNFYVSRIELTYYGGGVSEVCGYLTPDEGDGKTFDLYSPRYVEVTS